MTQEAIYKYKTDALIAAKELCYDKDIVERIRNAVTPGEIGIALATGRSRMPEDLPPLPARDKLVIRRRNGKKKLV